MASAMPSSRRQISRRRVALGHVELGDDQACVIDEQANGFRGADLV